MYSTVFGSFAKTWWGFKRGRRRGVFDRGHRRKLFERGHRSVYPEFQIPVQRSRESRDGGRATPKEIAEAEEAPRPHVSRAISELRERSVVELRVPETRSVGRYYGLTGKGEAAWRNLKEELRGVRWSIKEASEPEVRAAIELAKDEFGEGLRAVGTYDREGSAYTTSDRTSDRGTPRRRSKTCSLRSFWITRWTTSRYQVATVDRKRSTSMSSCY